MINGRKTYDDYFKDRESNNKPSQNKINPTSTMFGRNTSGVLATNTDYGNSIYDKNLNWGADIDESNINKSLNEHRAEQQSWQDHVGIGLVRTAAKAATEVAKLPGVIGGIAMSPFANENEGFETAFNNQWIKYFDSLNENVKEALPVYTKEAVKNGDFFDKISSSAFWAEDGADGAGFMVGALAPGALFKLFGGANALFGASIKAAKLAKYGEEMEAGRKALNAAGITIDKIDNVMIPAFNTIAEAGAEAKGVSDDLESRKNEFIATYTSSPQYQQDIITKNKELDVQRRNGEISIDEYNKLSANVANDIIESKFKEQKALAMQNTFVKNVAILAVPNYIQSKMLFGKTPSKVLLDKIGSIEKTGFKEGLIKASERIGESFLSEGSEEIGQTAVQNRNVKSALRNELGKDIKKDYNPVTFGEDFVKTLGTTEGQIAGFLGGIMGSPISIITGHRQDIADRKQTERLRDKINGESTAYQDVVKTNLYEQEEYTNPETGEISTRDKLVNGEKVLIPEAVAKVKNALDLNDQQSQIYDKAIQEGDINTIEYLKGQAEFNLITKFIGEDQVTLDALHEYLKVAFPIQKSENVSEQQTKINKENLDRVDKIMKKATTLQKDLASYKDMAASIIRINNPEVTEEHLSDFMNRVGYAFISERAEEFDAKDKLNKLEKQKTDLETNSSIVEIDNPNFIEGISSELDRKIKTRTNNPRLELINSQISKVKEQLQDFEEATNSTIWDNEYLNNKINNEVIAKKKLQKNTSPEVITKANEISQLINNATTPEELNNLPKTNTDTDKILQQKADEKKSELNKIKTAEETTIINNAKEDNLAFNDISKTDIYATEGSDLYNELTPITGENTTAEEDKEAKVLDPTEGKGVKLISYDRKNNKVLDFIEKQFPEGLAFERNPVNKIGNPVGFEINENPGVKLAEDALKQFKDGNFKDIQFLIDYLPINIKLAEKAYLPIETRRINDEINLETEMLRKSLITNLINGISITDMNSNITGQYKGILQIESPTAENNILNLSGVDGLKYIKENIYFVNILGQLENILTGQTRAFQNKFTKDLDRTKNYAAGEIYLMVPQADGISQFPLKLNISKLSIEESEGLFEIYKEILTQDKGSNTTLSEISPELLSIIQNIFSEELKVIAPTNKQKDIKLGEIIDLLIYESENPKSRINITDGILYFGDQSAHSNEIDSLKEDIISFLHNQKRHQIKIRPKTAEDNQRTNLSSNSADYIKYLVEGKILNTNAVVNQPLFQGYTNLFISPEVTIKGVKIKESTIEDKKADIEKRKDIEIRTASKSVYETGQYKGKAYNSWIDVEQELNIKYNTELTNLEKSIKKVKVKEYTESEIEDRFKGIRTLQELKEGYNSLNKEQQDLYKPLFTEKRIEIETGGVKVSDSGAEIASKNFEGLDFGENKLNNTRNIENKTVSLPKSTTVIENLTDSNKFVSSSDIPNTVENKQQMEKQNQVFKEPKGLEGQKDTKTITMLKYKVEKGTATEANLKQLEILKNKYGEEYVKNCK